MSMSMSTVTKSTVQESSSSEHPPSLRPVKPETPGAAGVETRDAATATPPATTKATGALNYQSDAHVPSYSSMFPSLPYPVIYPCFCLFLGIIPEIIHERRRKSLAMGSLYTIVMACIFMY